MSDELPGGGDPFGEADPEAAAREARRRRRQEHRQGTVSPQGDGDSGRRSLADRVSGVLGGAGDGEEEKGPSRAADPRPPDRRTLLRRRLVAGGVVLAALLVIFLLLSALRGGGEEQPVVTEEPLETVSVVVPEGLTIEQIADVAKDAKLTGSYEKAAKKAKKDFPLKRYGARGAPSLEGFLFPATYELEKGARSKDLVDKQLAAFRENFDTVNMKSAEKKNLTPYDVLIIASMVEEEVQVASERKKVSAVIYNRLSDGTALGIDATLRYELGNYDEQLKQSELDAATPYNTRLTPGLPPTPIANPGLAAIEAAADPADSDVLFFVIKPGTCGEHVFTADEDEFIAAEAAYQEALAAEGGSPMDCS